jgi:hypothetical protein
MTHDHHDGHDHAPIESGEAPPSYYDILETAVRELLTEKGLIAADEHRRQIEILDGRSPALGAKVVARAWVDPAYKKRLLRNGSAACEELGVTMYDDTKLIVLENTDRVHNFVVCTLCSCYPRPVLGLPPDWYKSRQYRSRAVSEPRQVLAEFGTMLPDDVVLPRRPASTEHLDEAALAALVTRDTMIGVATVKGES